MGINTGAIGMGYRVLSDVGLFIILYFARFKHIYNKEISIYQLYTYSCVTNANYETLFIIAIEIITFKLEIYLI